MGQYDAVIISEFPSDEAVAKLALSVGALGNVTTETHSPKASIATSSARCLDA